MKDIPPDADGLTMKASVNLEPLIDDADKTGGREMDWSKAWAKVKEVLHEAFDIFHLVAAPAEDVLAVAGAVTGKPELAAAAAAVKAADALGTGLESAQDAGGTVAAVGEAVGAGISVAATLGKAPHAAAAQDAVNAVTKVAENYLKQAPAIMAGQPLTPASHEDAAALINAMMTLGAIKAATK